MAKTNEFDLASFKKWSAFVRMWATIGNDVHRRPVEHKRVNPYHNARAIIWAANHGEIKED